MKRYAIWNKTDPVLTPLGKLYTAEEWIEKYPIAALPTITVICGAGEINGSYFGTLGQMIKNYEGSVDFSACETDEDKLAAIEAWEDYLNTPSNEPTTEERTAAALEFIAMASLPDEEV